MGARRKTARWKGGQARRSGVAEPARDELEFPGSPALSSLRSATFRVGLKGYHCGDVDKYLDRAAEEVTSLLGRDEAERSGSGHSAFPTLSVLRTVEFRLGLRGYEVGEVDWCLDRAAVEADPLLGDRT
jgi:DivIVA domain-containing protein